MKQLLDLFKIITLSLIVTLGASYIYAAGTWIGPVSQAPLDNTPAPINIGAIGQIKEGGLTIASGAGILNGLIVLNGKVGIGTSTPAEKVSVNGKVLANDFCLQSDPTKCLSNMQVATAGPVIVGACSGDGTASGGATNCGCGGKGYSNVPTCPAGSTWTSFGQGTTCAYTYCGGGGCSGDYTSCLGAGCNGNLCNTCYARPVYFYPTGQCVQN